MRDWVCPNCQTHHDRYENAAKNLRAEGLRILSTNTAGQTEFQACGEDVRLVNTCVKKRMRPSRRPTAACTHTKQQSSVNQKSPILTSSLTKSEIIVREDVNTLEAFHQY